MNTTDKKIAEVLAKFGEPMAGNVWRVQGTAVIYHKTLERIAAVAGIRFDDPKIIRAERDEAVILVAGEMDVGEVVAGTQTPCPRREWSIGEAAIGTNYRVSGKQAAYPFAMAEKRAKDRVILKLIELSGVVYSEEEADDFKRSNADREEAAHSPVEVQKDAFGLPQTEEDESKSRYIEQCKDKIAQLSITEAELRNWWTTQSGARRSFGLTQDEVDQLKKLLTVRLEEFKRAA